MIILNPRLKLRGKRYGSVNVHISLPYSNENRIAIMIDFGERLFTFDGTIGQLKNDIANLPLNSSYQFDNYFIQKSMTRVKIIFPDLTTLIGKISDFED
jgi:hypothetical protein